MDPKEYYYQRFRSQFDEWAKKSTPHNHPGEGTYIPIQSLSAGNLSHIPKDDQMLFHCALACTVLIDQVIYSHFKKDYPKFQAMTQYPKIEAGITGINVNPWMITHSGIGLTTLERFINFFVNDLRDFFAHSKFEEASWENVKNSILNDSEAINGPRGEILKKVLEQRD